MSSLESIRIRNYRCFEDHTIRLGRPTVIVGKNNAGKSTLIEAIRLLAIALRRFNNPVAVQAPEWLDDLRPGNGQRLDLAQVGVWAGSIFHHYSDPPATIEGTFKDGARVVLHLGPDGEGHAVLFTPQGRAIRRRPDIGNYQIPLIAILPQIVPLEREERVLDSGYVRQRLDSNLASRHFRNQLSLLRDPFFTLFAEAVESSWPGVRVEGLEVGEGEGGEILRLMVRDSNFVAEVGWMGHGLQMWLQTVWFVTRSAAAGTIVLDEPDVYMHPDLQRRLVRMLGLLRPEMLIATHSTEILSEVDATQILVLDRARPQSSHATDMSSVQRIVESMGSAQNLQITRLWRARSLVLVEGDDMKILKRVYDVICPPGASPLDSTPNWSIGGWTGWTSALQSVVALRNAVQENIRCYCIFDRDYHLQQEIDERFARAAEGQIELHIHSMKEIENYLISADLIRRALIKNAGPDRRPPAVERVQAEIDAIVQDLLATAQDSFVGEFLNHDRPSGPTVASRRARELLQQRRDDSRGELGIVSGKDLLRRLSTWAQQSFGISFGLASLLRELRPVDVDPELRDLVISIAAARALPVRRP